jgi:hypothetical protein
MPAAEMDGWKEVNAVAVISSSQPTTGLNNRFTRLSLPRARRRYKYMSLQSFTVLIIRSPKSDEF